MQGVLAGCFAGLTNSIIVGPVELVKIKLQLQKGRIHLIGKHKHITLR